MEGWNYQDGVWFSDLSVLFGFSFSLILATISMYLLRFTKLVAGIAPWVLANSLSHMNDNIWIGLETMRNLTFFLQENRL